MDNDPNGHRNSNINKICEHHEGNNTTGSDSILDDGQDHTENIIDETTTNLNNEHQPHDRGIDDEVCSAETPDEFAQSESINTKREKIFKPNSIAPYRAENSEMYDGNTSEEQHPQNNLPTPFVEWIYPPRDETNPDNNSLNLEHFVDPSDGQQQVHTFHLYIPQSNPGVTYDQQARNDNTVSRHRVEWIYPDGPPSLSNLNDRQRVHDRSDNEPRIPSDQYDHAVNPSDITIAPSVIDGVIVQNKRCFLKICGIHLCDDFFPYAINPKLLPCLIAFIIVIVAVSTFISIYMTGPSETDLNDLLSKSVDLSPSQTPTNVALIASSLNPSMTPSMSPSYQCIVKYPYLNERLIGNGICDGGKYFVEDCGYDGGDCIPSLDLVGKAYGGTILWSFVLGPDGNIYGIPVNADVENILKFDPSNHETGLVGKDLGNFKWRTAVLGNDGMIYGIPSRSKSILKYDPILSSISFIAEGNELLTGDDKFYGGVVAKNDNIYFIPYDHNKVLIYNSSNIEKPLVEISDDLGWGISKFRNGVLGKDGNIYGIPYNANKVLKISVSDNTVSFIGNNLIGTGKFSNGVLAKNGNIYACPKAEFRVLRINTTDETVSLVGPGLEQGSNKWSGFVEGPDGLLYGIPYNSDNLLIFDPDMETATTIPLDENFVGKFFKWDSGVLGDNGVIYASPYYYANILAITSNSKGNR